MSQERRKTRIGHVVSDKTEKTVIVAVQWRQRHPLYHKSVRRVTKFPAHDEENTCRIGDQVRIVETRPLSRTKRWRVVEVLARGEVPDVKPSEFDVKLEELVPAAAAPMQVTEFVQSLPPPSEQVAEAAQETETETEKEGPEA